MVWYNILTKETWGHIRTIGFELVLHLLPEMSSGAVLVQTLVKRWWDITHTFHITDQEMTVTPCDFHRMTGLQFDRFLISLEYQLGTQLGVVLLERRYAMEMICYTDLEADFTEFMCRPWGMVEECDRMARVFIPYLLEVYFFANGG